MIDAHNHLQRFDQPDVIIAEMRAAGITHCVVNGTSEADWEDVANLARAFPDVVQPAFGLHPWFAGRRSDGWLKTLEGYLDRFPGASIGECGLDRWVDEPSIDAQRAAFLPQLALARERQLPITIHALKAWGPLHEALEREAPSGRGFLLHSYGGSLETARRLADLGARFSFSGYFLQPRKAAMIDVYRQLPSDRLLLETDAPEMSPPPAQRSHPLPDHANHPANLPAIATAFAARLGAPSDHLLRRCEANARAFFQLDPDGPDTEG